MTVLHFLCGFLQQIYLIRCRADDQASAFFAVVRSID
jgi:hypothetical protein